jgi:hypothetical protein
MKFEKLGDFDAARLNPLLRLVFVAVLTAVFSVLLHQRVLVIAIASYELNSFYEKPMVAVVVGIFCGFADLAVSGFIAGAFDKAAGKT